MDTENSKINKGILAAITGHGAERVLPIERIPVLHICHSTGITDRAICGEGLHDGDICIYENVAYIEDNRADICIDCLCVYDAI